ncbi:MAG: glycosyltransferase family 2 protein [Planctomycetes bacterium]|nr:glycosyltransferase family 2 protein [Planctomycetota bacterium]
MTDRSGLRFTLVVPVFDEEENVEPLLDEVRDTLLPHGPFEAIFVDDKSRDRSLERMKAWKERNTADWLRIVTLEQNRGQSTAVLAGAMQSRAPIIATLDGDRQNDPADLPKMIAMIESGAWDGVTGVRRKRKDTWVRRRSSAIGNGVRNWITGDRVTDSACGAKAYRRELFLAVPRFHGMHRFMATLVRYCGGRVTEIDVNHRPRVAGQAKYGIGNRAIRGLKDCLAVRWMRSRVIVYRIAEES